MEMTKEHIFAETKKLQYLYGLKYEIRYDQKREDVGMSESVADHIYAMHILATYFLPLEDPEHKWNWERIHEMITWHDIDEVETGDMLGHLKTDADRAREKEAAHVVIASMPESMREHVAALLEEYEKRETIESKFTKAIDKIESTVHCFNPTGKRLLQSRNTSCEDHKRISVPHFKPFPTITTFGATLTQEMCDKGYFTDCECVGDVCIIE